MKLGNCSARDWIIKRHFFCLDTKEMTKEKVKTDEKYGKTAAHFVAQN